MVCVNSLVFLRLLTRAFRVLPLRSLNYLVTSLTQHQLILLQSVHLGSSVTIHQRSPARQVEQEGKVFGSPEAEPAELAPSSVRISQSHRLGTRSDFIQFIKPSIPIKVRPFWRSQF